MGFNVEFKNNKAILTGEDKFCLETTLDCGQCFRWKQEQGVFLGVAHNRVINLYRKDDSIVMYPVGKDDYYNIWENYFDLKRDYLRIQKTFAKDGIIEKSIEYADGIRVLNQQPFETLISFIISANNNVGRIRGIVEKLSRKYGKKLGVGVYSFPTAGVLANTALQDVLACGAGYRAEYIIDTAKSITQGFDLEGLRQLPYSDAKKELTKLKGVGAKVADCVLLYSLGYKNAFPTDVWIRRVIYNLYGYKGKSEKELRDFVTNKFGDYAGIAQQYLFHYVRKNKLGV